MSYILSTRFRHFQNPRYNLKTTSAKLTLFKQFLCFYLLSENRGEKIYNYKQNNTDERSKSVLGVRGKTPNISYYGFYEAG